MCRADLYACRHIARGLTGELARPAPPPTDDASAGQLQVWMTTLITVPGFPVVFSRAQKRSWVAGVPICWNPTCGRVVIPLVTVLTFHPASAWALVTFNVVLLFCSRVTVPALSTVNVAVFPTPGAGCGVTVFAPQVVPAAPGAVVEAPTGVAAKAIAAMTTAVASTARVDLKGWQTRYPFLLKVFP
jgi:hypothetical protein